MILWSEKCACSSLTYWIEHNFEELAQCRSKPGTYLNKPRAYLHKRGYNHNELSDARELLANNSLIEHLIVSHREPVKRMTSSFVNKFMIRGKHILPFNSNKLETFSKDFLETYKSLKRSNPRKKYRLKTRDGQQNHASIIMKLSLKKFVATIIHPTINRDSLNDHFCPQITSQSQWEDYSKIVEASKAVHPLRVAQFDKDLERINQRMGLDDFLPEKTNSTRLPGENWSFSEQAEASNLNLAKLCSMKIVPKSASLRKLLVSKTKLDDRFKEVFQFDYKLGQHLDHLTQSG